MFKSYVKRSGHISKNDSLKIYSIANSWFYGQYCDKYYLISFRITLSILELIVNIYIVVNLASFLKHNSNL